MKKRAKSPWPTKAVMTQIYDKHLWGGREFDFYSGEGSHQINIIEPYIAVVSEFLKSKNSALRVCDLGCGDFNVGKHLTKYAKCYVGVDIVEPLINRNMILFQRENLEFQCLDISKDDLPKADCVILRQVLQHLSNGEIKEIIPKLYNYKYLILTEHLPLGDFTPNADKITSLGNRLKYNSGVDLMAEPFNFNVLSSNVLNDISLGSKKGRLVTTLYQLS